MSDLNNLVRLAIIGNGPPAGTPAFGGQFYFDDETNGVYFGARGVDAEGNTTIAWQLSDLINQANFLRFLQQVAPDVTRAEAVAGVSTDRKTWTPERVKQAILALAPDDLTQGEFNAFLNNVSPLATLQDLIDGVATRKDFTPRQICLLYTSPSPRDS